MNPHLDKLQPYPFEKLASLKQGVLSPQGLDHIALAIGEPAHPTPGFIVEELLAHLHGLARYPVVRGGESLRTAIAEWLTRRHALPANSLDPDRHILPVSGTREALFSLAQAVVDPRPYPIVMMPNPFYQIYEGATLLAGAQPYYLNCEEDNGFVPNFQEVSDKIWSRCQLVYVCTPGNPTGAVLAEEVLADLITLAERHDFVVASDECYSEIYIDEGQPPPGLLGVAARLGNTRFQRCVVFNSLSKRSNAPGLRSGFVAGDANVIKRFYLYRTYHGCAMPLPTQAASRAAWLDEAHVSKNRALYREKFSAVSDILSDELEIRIPPGGFYLWPHTPIDDESFTKGLFSSQHVTVLPGSFLGREVNGNNPGRNRVRMALVASLDECVDAAHRIRNYVASI